MFDQLVERFCEFDDFCQAVGPQWEATMLTEGQAGKHKPGPERGLANAGIMTLLVPPRRLEWVVTAASCLASPGYPLRRVSWFG
jgi:hypothetical protein